LDGVGRWLIGRFRLGLIDAVRGLRNIFGFLDERSMRRLASSLPNHVAANEIMRRMLFDILVGDEADRQGQTTSTSIKKARSMIMSAFKVVL
jgi:hypothetical protein